MQFGYAGVELFFIISGYIIMYVTDRGAFDPREFLLKRFIRIYPIYIGFSLIPLTALFLAPTLRKEGLPSFSEILASLTIFPQIQAPVLGPGWSLEHEVIFYLIVAGLLTAGLRRWIIPVLLVCTAAGTVIHGLRPIMGYPDVWDWHIFSPFQFGFAVGAAIYQYRERLAAAGTLVPLALGSLLTCVCAVVIEPFRTGGVWAASGAPLLIEVFGYTAAFAPIVVALLNRDRSKAATDRSWPVAGLVLIGDASYVLYLCNYIFLAIALKALPGLHLPADLLWFYMALAFGVCIAAAVAIHLWIERPYLRIAGRMGAAVVRRGSPA